MNKEQALNVADELEKIRTDLGVNAIRWALSTTIDTETLNNLTKADMHIKNAIKQIRTGAELC